MGVHQQTSPQTKLQRLTYRVWLAVGVLLLLWAGFRVLGRPLAVIVPPILLAIIIVYLLNPLVSRLEAGGVPRWAGTALAYAGLLLALVLAGVLLTPLLIDQMASLAEAAPELGSRMVEGVNSVLSGTGIRWRVGATLTGEELAGEIRRFLSTEENRTAALAVLGGISGVATGLLHVLLVFVVGPVIALYLLIDLPRARAWAERLVPPAYLGEIQAVGRRLGEVVGGYVRGQLLVALFVGVASSIGLALIGLRFWLVVGVVAGITNLIPLLGPFVAGLLGVGVALVTDGIGRALLVVVVMTVVQQTDNHVVSPLVMGRNVRLHPLVVLLALLVAGTLYGIFGLFVAVPAVAAVNVLAGHVWHTRVPWAHPEAPDHPPLEPATPTPERR